MLLHPMKAQHQLALHLLPQKFSVCRMAPGAALPQWATRGAMFSITRTAHELSVVCESKFVPGNVKSEKGWRCLELQGPFPFEMTGVLASVLEPLAAATISIFALSTFDTDCVMVKEKSLGNALKVLRAAGHFVNFPE
jgi:hypothetical protein